mgnify:CR=1 FL=1
MKRGKGEKGSVEGEGLEGVGLVKKDIRVFFRGCR